MTSPTRILLIDDDEPLHAIMARVVARSAYEPTFARTGSDGLALAAELDPAVIVVDLRMPGMDGHTFLRRLAPLGLAAAVIVSSGTGEMDDVIEVVRLGAIDFVRKPWDPRELRTALARAVEIHAKRIESKRGVSPAEPRTDPPASTVFQSILTRIQSDDILLPTRPSVVE